MLAHKGEITMKRSIEVILLFLILFLTINVTSVDGKPREDYGQPKCIYKGENGLTIVSYSTAWSTKERLDEIYRELLNNFYGEEMQYLSHIYIYPDNRENVAGYYYEDYYMDENGELVYLDHRYIELYNADVYTEISDIARTLAHEYGHHFTFYYLITHENKAKNNWLLTEYAELRNLSDFDGVTYIGDPDKPYQHEWDIAEILAEDYVQLLGSPLAKQTEDYFDVQERVDRVIRDYYYRYHMFNLLPQENLSLPLAADVKGLMEYLSNLASLEIVNKPRDIDVPTPYLTGVEPIYKEYNQYTFEWDEIDDGYEYDYTLVYYDLSNNDYPIPIKTVKTTEEMRALAGSAINYEKNSALLQNLEGELAIQLFVTDEYGFIYASEPNTIKISPKDNAVVIFYDVPEGFWAENHIYDLYNKGLIAGYPDGSFKPDNTISRAEFLTLLIRGSKSFSPHKVDDRNHWFVTNGYYDIALFNGLIEGPEDNEFYFDENIQREEMAVLIYKMLNLLEKDTVKNSDKLFKDRSKLTYKDEISVVSNYGIISGYSDNTFRPSHLATRAEASKMLSTFISVVGS